MYISNLNSNRTQGIMTFPCKMEDIVNADFRTEWYENDLPPSPYQNVAGITDQVSIDYIFIYLR